MVKTHERKLNLITQTNRWTDTEQVRSTNSTSHSNPWKLHNSHKYNKEGENPIYIYRWMLAFFFFICYKIGTKNIPTYYDKYNQIREETGKPLAVTPQTSINIQHNVKQCKNII